VLVHEGEKTLSQDLDLVAVLEVHVAFPHLPPWAPLRERLAASMAAMAELS
jgi:hypothetical protein